MAWIINKLSYEEALKLKAVVLYILEKCGSLDYIHLFKIIYFADCNHYAKYGRRLIADTFCAMDNGPVPSNLYDAIKLVRRDKRLPAKSALKVVSSAIRRNGLTANYIIEANESPDMDELSKSDIICLDESIKENINLNFSQISKKSHRLAWTEAYKADPNSPIDPMLMAREGGASEEMIDFILENTIS